MLTGAADTQPPSVPDGLTSSTISVTGFTLGWRASTDNVKVTAYEVFKDGVSAGTTAGLTKTFGALTPATSYALTVRARDAKANWSAPSAALVVSTLHDITPPSVPDALTASGVKLRSITLTWSAAADDVKVTNYEVFRNGMSAGTTTGRSKNLTGLNPDTAYVLAVRACDAAGNWSATSEAITVKTLADLEPPSVPTGLSASAVATTKFSLKWAAAKDNLKVAAYEVFQNGVSLGTVASASKIIAGLAPATAYAMTVRAGDAAGNWSGQSAVLTVTTTADTAKPSTPGGLAVRAVSPVGFALSWNPSTDNVGVVAYEVFRDGVSMGVTATPALNLAGLVPNTIYTVRVRARDGAGNWSGQSAALKVKTLVADLVPPSAPTGLASSGRTATGFILSWTAASDDIGVTRYEVFQNGVSLGTTSLTSIAVAGLLPGSSNHMTVRAGDAAGNWSDLSAGWDVTVSDVPFITGFEPADDYHPGSLNGQNGWSVTGTANIGTSLVATGRQSVTIMPARPPSFVTRAFSTVEPGITFVDLFALPAAAPQPDMGVFLETEAAEVALTGANGRGVLQAFDGDGAGGGRWLSTGTGPALDAAGRADTWTRLTIRSDYAVRKWDLYFNGQLIAANLGFVSDPPVALRALSLAGHTTATTGFDELFVAFDNPLFIDADKDGIEDAWESAHGLNPAVNDRDVDPDGSGLSAIQHYLRTSNPSNPDADNDGLADAWELRYFGSLRHGPGADPGEVGRTLLQSLQQNLNPWPQAVLPAGLRA
jgi:chitodextrinase